MEGWFPSIGGKHRKYWMLSRKGRNLGKLGFWTNFYANEVLLFGNMISVPARLWRVWLGKFANVKKLFIGRKVCDVSVICFLKQISLWEKSIDLDKLGKLDSNLLFVS